MEDNVRHKIIKHQSCVYSIAGSYVEVRDRKPHILYSI